MTTTWTAPKRPVEHAEEHLITAILDGTFPPGSTLPGERELAVQLGVTRPTLREVLRRLEGDGWLNVHQGKSTQVKDFWREGGLNILSGIVRHSKYLPPNFVDNLLEVRLQLAPAYTHAAMLNNPAAVVTLLQDSTNLEDTPEAYATYDWQLQHGLTVASGNPIYTLILNGFTGFYEELARRYFMLTNARAASLTYYEALLHAAQSAEAEAAEQITRDMMRVSIRFWQQAAQSRRRD
jgi:GntR family negative regulator for fad regulon and positive regulator of fabA